MNKIIDKPNVLSKFLTICSRNGYFEATSVTEKSIENIKFLSHIKLLQENIERAAFHTDKNIENSLKVFGDKDFDANESQLSLPEKYSLIRTRNRSTKNTPFKLVEMCTNATSTLWKSIASDDERDISVQLPTNSKSLSFSCFVHEKQAREYFYRIQRQRKIWWMQYAANPGRFFISEVKSNDSSSESNQNEQSISLKVTYPFGNLAIEHIELLPIESVYPEQAGNNSIPNRIVRSSTLLELAAIEMVLDSIDAGDFGEMCLHRKIAPYQCSVYCFAKGKFQCHCALCNARQFIHYPIVFFLCVCRSFADASFHRELEELAKYITMMLNKCRVSIFNLKNSTFSIQSDLERKFTEMDAIGIPYGLILDENSLQNGVMKLRCRDTTLCETIHISYLSRYLSQIFRS